MPNRKRHALWRQPDGSPVSCAEKIKVLDQNLAEFRALALDFLEDAVLMGCDEEEVRARLKDTLAQIQITIAQKE